MIQFNLNTSNLYSRSPLISILLLAILFMSVGPANADPLQDSINTSIANTRQEAKLQQRIDKLDDETRAMLDEYLSLSRELEQLSVYNDQLQRLVSSQVEEKSSILRQMNALELTQREIVPLTLRMLAWLEELISLDLPFLTDERTQRVAHLNTLMDRADVTIGEKYRRLLEAYQIELEYGRTIEAYRGELQSDGQARTVDFLRIGRIGLYYLTLDRDEAGHWNHETNTWEALPDRYQYRIRDGLRMARKQAAPDLLRLPVSAAVEVQP